MSRLMCFRPIKKHRQFENGDVYGTLKKDSNANLAPGAHMSTNGVIEAGLSLQYVTAKFIVLTSPDGGSESAYTSSLAECAKTLKAKHFQHYKVWSVSRRRGDVTRLLGCSDAGWPAGLAPPLDRLCVLCKQMEQWMAGHTDNVVVVHCKGDPSRAAMVVSSFMHYKLICSTDEDTIDDRFCMQRFSDRYIGGCGQPSHRRYITYFSSLLSGRVRVNPAPLYLLRVTVSHLNGRLLSFKVYERLHPVYQTQPVTSKEVAKWEIDGELRLRGDVVVKCQQTISSHRSELFLCQLNTCSIEVADRTASLSFHKEDLDLIFADPSVDNRVRLDLVVSLDPPTKVKDQKPKSWISEGGRINSYEEFLNSAEDEPSSTSAEYSEIRKDKRVIEEKRDAEKEAESEKESETREQVEGETEKKKTKKNGKAAKEQKEEYLPNMPPPVPPKPRSASAMADPITEVPERRGVLPSQVRPIVAHRPPSPQLGRATPSIEPDLVGKDRYDKASKCFSYAPAKALNEAFERPRRQSVSRTLERREDEATRAEEHEANGVHIPTSEPPYRPSEPAKWDEQVERTKQDALLEELARMPARSQSVTGHPYYNRRNEWEDEREEEREERPVVVEQAQRAVATATPTSTLQRKGSKYGSYKTLNDERYNSVMDDLCDPDFYLNYQSPTAQPSAAPAPPPRAHAGAKSVELPRRRFQPVEAFTDPLDDILNSSPRLGQRNKSSGPAPAASCLELSDRDAFRNRNCRSVATTLPSRDRRLFAEDYDAPSQANDPDDWLSNKLRKVRSKRELDPDLARRKTQEKVLLEELKHANDDREVARNRMESDYTVEGMGSRGGVIDPLAEYRREEERLKNTHSPFQDGPRRGRQVRGKPPTPPPRERSRSPTRSERATPSIDSHYNSYRYQNGGVSTGAGVGGSQTNGVRDYHQQYQQPQQYQQQNHEEDFDFSTLNNIVQPSSAAAPSSGRESRSLRRKPSFDSRPPFQYNENLNQRPDTPTRFYSGQERVAAAISRAETPQRELYASGTIHRAETPNRYYPENSTTMPRSETPAFPVNRETPVPFHPLLYSNQNAASRQDLDRAQTLNYRSSSPRSQYGMSRRSSLTSVDTSEIINHHPIFVKDTSKYWYKPNISREQAINMLRDKQPGTFVVRDSNSFPGAFGLALKVAQPPPGVAPGDGTELVRHFLIEPSPKGVKLKGCNNEPVFGSLSALVYQHSITPLALPTKLLLPEFDPSATPEHVSATQALLEQGAACNVAYIGSVDVESLTGSECIRRAIGRAAEQSERGETRPVSVHFKVSSQGVTLTDNTRKVFFRRHFPVNSVIYAGMDPADRRFDNYCVIGFHDGCVSNANMFAFVARKPGSAENVCHVFAEFEPEQPGSAVVNFINKVMLAIRRS